MGPKESDFVPRLACGRAWIRELALVASDKKWHKGAEVGTGGGGTGHRGADRGHQGGPPAACHPWALQCSRTSRFFCRRYFLCDRTPLIPEAEKAYSRDLFLFIFLVLTVVAFGSSLQVRLGHGAKYPEG